jgi:FG-GAP repeat protein
MSPCQMTGQTILVGAAQHDDATGAAYVFTQSGGGWRQTSELTASDPVQSGGFGWGVALSADGSTALVGANGQGVAGEGYVFRESRRTWTQTTVLSPSDGEPGDAFGDAVALTGDGSTAVVGAPVHGGAFTGVGAAYVFGESGEGWTQTAELSPSDGAAEDGFGISVAVSRTGSVVAIGASGHHKAFGSAYVFTRSAGSDNETEELTAADGSGFDFFGTSLAVSGNGSVIAVGADLHHHQAGAEYIYTRNADAWTQKAELASTRRRESDWFGCSTGISDDGSTLLIGAFSRGPYNPGSAFVFTR